METDTFFLAEIEKFKKWYGINNQDFHHDSKVYDEILRDMERSVANVEQFRTKKWHSIYELGIFRFILYWMTRITKPDLIVETGILHGITSQFILAALRENKKGTLISVDLPSYFEAGPSNQDGFFDTLPPGKEPGWIVPDKYKDKWEIQIGSSAEILPKLVKKYGAVDIFLHDSEHTYSTMINEYSTMWPIISPRGILVSDNINVNTAFFDFALKVGQPPLTYPEGIIDGKIQGLRFGMIKK